MMPALSPAALEWAQRLVRFNTVSDQSNLPLIECIADHLRTLHVPLVVDANGAKLSKSDDAGAKPHLDKIIAREAGQNRHWATGGRAPYFRARITEREGNVGEAKKAYADIIATVPLGYYAWLAQARLGALDAAAATQALAAAEQKDEAAAAAPDEPERESFVSRRARSA